MATRSNTETVQFYWENNMIFLDINESNSGTRTYKIKKELKEEDGTIGIQIGDGIAINSHFTSSGMKDGNLSLTKASINSAIEKLENLKEVVEYIEKIEKEKVGCNS